MLHERRPRAIFELRPLLHQEFHELGLLGEEGQERADAAADLLERIGDVGNIGIDPFA